VNAAIVNLQAPLDELIGLAGEAEWVYSNAGQDGKDAALVAFAMKRAAQCKHRADDLASISVLYGRSPEQGDSVSSIAHRTWTQLRSAVGARNDLQLLDDCERIEDETLRAYTRLLRRPLPASLRIALREEFNKSQKFREQLIELGSKVFELPAVNSTRVA
jgi:uncharacterized protein (TIGR02284 family)